MALCVMIFLLVIPASLAQEDMNDKVFLFPKDKHTDHVSLTSNITKPLEKFSVCLYFFRDFLRNFNLFSLASPGTGNKFYFSDSSSSNTVHMNKDSALFRTNMEPYEWKHTCVTWNSDTGVVKLWVNGKLYPRRVCMKGASIPAETSMVLGQKQDSFEQRPTSYPFVGEMSDVHMWDYVLTPEEMLQALNKNAHGNIINWNSLLYEIKGDILVLPKSRCSYQITSKSCK
ncbi:C-reactive protein-like [Aquarana catesbeiana]|uniref:C-reactive protein-like n=1 Tax=Aquarana catesbeiana TaxID=8400 RepID=UPI003CCA211D